MPRQPLALAFMAISGASILSPASGQAQQPRLLVVLSEADSITLKGGKRHDAGYFLSELLLPLAEAVKLGYAPTFATPTGRKPSVDRASDDPRFFKDAAEYTVLKKLHAALPGLEKPASVNGLTEELLSGFDAALFPGGHAALADLARSPQVGQVLRHFHSRAKPTALVCHGPAALLAARDAAGTWPYKGYRMTAFSTAEEKQAESRSLGGELESYLDENLRSSGGDVSTAAPWTAHVVRDRELITAQNPQSDRELTRALLIALAESRLAKARVRAAYHPGLRELESAKFYEVAPFPKKWREGYTNVYVGARKPNVGREDFFKRLVPHLDHARRVFGPVGMRGYVVLSNGDHEIAFMNWPSREAADGAGAAPGQEAVSEDAADFLDSLVLAPVPEPGRLKHPALP